MSKLRDYQERAVDAIFKAWRDGSVSTLAVLPTGSGKTRIFAEVLKRAWPRKGIVLAHRIELIDQAATKIEKWTGLHCEVEMGNRRANMQDGLFVSAQVLVSSVQTQGSGGDGSGRMSRFDPNLFGILVIDESHRVVSKSYKRIINYYKTNPNLKILLVTATPDRADGKAMGQVADTVCFDYEILDAINDGWLVPVVQQMVHIEGLDFSGVRTHAGDLNGADLSAVMEQEKTLHGVADATIQICKDKRTLVFAASVAQGERLSDILNRHKPNCSAFVCAKTDAVTRKRMFDDFSYGRTQFLVNVGIATEGWDDSALDGVGVQCVVMARPTKSRSLYAQMAGRGIRPLPGVVDEADDNPEHRKACIAASPKQDCLILDFVGNSGKHKLMTTADILGGTFDDEVKERAIERAKQEGGKISMVEVLAEEEEKRKEELEKKRQREIARKERLIAKAQFTCQDINPFDRYHITPSNFSGGGRMLTDKQREALIRQGVNPDRISFGDGRRILGEIMRAKNTETRDTDPIMFGKHKGKQFGSMDAGYWRFMLGNMKPEFWKYYPAVEKYAKRKCGEA